MLELKNICIKEGEFSLSGISVNVETGGYHAIAGPSGSGKTMLLNVIAGFVKPISGSVIFNGTDITYLPPEKRNIAYLFQDLALFPHLNVYDNVAYPLRMKGFKKEEISKTVDEYLEFTSILHLKNRDTAKLSGGEKQRVALARILAMKSQLILLDEPFSAIDTQLQPELVKLLKKISESGITVVHVSHSIDETISLSKTISVLYNGKIVQSGPAHDVIYNPANKFIAGFAGIKNFLQVNDTVNEGEKTIVLINEKKVEIASSECRNISAVIIDPDRIEIYSENKKGSFSGIIQNIVKTRNGAEIEVNIGFTVFVNIDNRNSLYTNVKKGDSVFINIDKEIIRPVF